MLGTQPCRSNYNNLLQRQRRVMERTHKLSATSTLDCQCFPEFSHWLGPPSWDSQYQQLLNWRIRDQMTQTAQPFQFCPPSQAERVPVQKLCIQHTLFHSPRAQTSGSSFKVQGPLGAHSITHSLSSAAITLSERCEIVKKIRSHS